MIKHKIITIIQEIGILSVLIGILAYGGYADSHYTTRAKIVKNNCGYITIETLDGNVWDLYDEGIYQRGDYVNVTFHNNYTENYIYDDIVEKISHI